MEGTALSAAYIAILTALRRNPLKLTDWCTAISLIDPALFFRRYSCKFRRSSWTAYIKHIYEINPLYPPPRTNFGAFNRFELGRTAYQALLTFYPIAADR